MNNININARILHKNDSEANWNKIPNFVPKKGEIIIYNIDATHTVPRLKIGDGNAFLVDLPFLSGENSQEVLDHIANSSVHVSETDRARWNQKMTCSVSSNNLIFQVEQ